MQKNTYKAFVSTNLTAEQLELFDINLISTNPDTISVSRGNIPNEFTLTAHKEGVSLISVEITAKSSDTQFTISRDSSLTLVSKEPEDNIVNPIKRIYLTTNSNNYDGDYYIYQGSTLSLSAYNFTGYISEYYSNDIISFYTLDPNIATVKYGETYSDGYKRMCDAIITAENVGTTEIYYVAKGNMTSHGIYNHISVRVVPGNFTGEMVETLIGTSHITVVRGATFQAKIDESLGKVSYWNLNSNEPINGITISPEGLISVDSVVSLDTHCSIACYYTDNQGKEQVIYYNLNIIDVASETDSTTDSTIKDIQVSINLNTSGELNNNKTYTASLVFSPELSADDIADLHCDIYSDSPSVVSTAPVDITNYGTSFTVTPNEDGTANLIPYIWTDKASFNFTYVPLSVTVNSPSADIETPVNSIVLSVANGSTTMYEGDKLGLSVKVLPSIHDDILTWSTSNASVATVENGIVTAVGPGVATITYRAKGNFTTNGVSNSITVTVQSSGSVNDALSRITIRQGHSFQISLDSSVGTVISWMLSSQIEGVSLDGTGNLSVASTVAAGTSFQLSCAYLDATGAYNTKTYNVIVQRAVSSNTEAYAIYSITVEDDEEYEWADFGFDFEGYDLVVDDEDDCTVDFDRNSIVANLVDDDKGTASVEVYDGDTKVAVISITVISKEYEISISKSGTAYIEDELEDLLGENNVNVISVVIDSQYNNLLTKGESSSKGYYIKGQGTKGTAYITVAYSAGNKVGSITVTVNIG